MSRQAKARAIAWFHGAWVVSILLLPATPLYRLVPWMLGAAGVLYLVIGECFLLLWEYRYRPDEELVSMSRRLFGLIGIHFEEEEEVGPWILFLSGLALVQSALRWWLG